MILLFLLGLMMAVAAAQDTYLAVDDFLSSPSCSKDQSKSCHWNGTLYMNSSSNSGRPTTLPTVSFVGSGANSTALNLLSPSSALVFAISETATVEIRNLTLSGFVLAEPPALLKPQNMLVEGRLSLKDVTVLLGCRELRNQQILLCEAGVPSSLLFEVGWRTVYLEVITPACC